jgi:two-component system OmpR family sensor kinase
MANRIKELVRSHREMTHAVSHELRTPLARMKFALEMAEKNENLVKIRNHLSSIRSDVGEMDTLVSTLLYYASMEESNSKPLVKTGDMNYLVAQLIKRISLTKPEQVSIHFEDRSSNGHVECDWHLMERAIFNLLQNAARFAMYRIDTTLLSDESHYHIVVEDDGPGIPVEQRQSIFESFVRLNTKSSVQASGFGLGLAIVKRVALWHQGTITISESRYGGARFKLSWPQNPTASGI